MSAAPWLLLDHPAIANLLEMHRTAEQRRRIAGFNICSFTAEFGHYENLHSDILQALLDPQGLHGEKHLFGDLFLGWVQRHVPSLRLDDFKRVRVEREKGRVDLLIHDAQTARAVIVENKINDAPNQERQLDRYLQYGEKHSLEVQAIVYLSLDGSKFAPPTEAGVDHLVFNAAAFADHPDDLVNGWLNCCLQQAVHPSSRSFVQQYIAHIQTLASMSFDLNILKGLYDHLSTHQEHERHLELLIHLREGLPGWRARIFGESIKNPRPFREFGLYKPRQNHWLFIGWTEQSEEWKIDVVFDQESVGVSFWNPNRDHSIASIAVREKLASVVMLEPFLTGETYGNGLKITFGPEHGSLRQRDSAATNFVIQLLERLRSDEMERRQRTGAGNGAVAE